MKYIDIPPLKDLTLPFKIQAYHFFKKRIENDNSSTFDFNLSSFSKHIRTLFKPEDNTNFIIINNNEVLGLNETTKKFLTVVTSIQNNANLITLQFNTSYLFSSAQDLNIYLLEIDFEGILEFKFSDGNRMNNKNTYENSINILHDQINFKRKKSLYIFNNDDINNNPLNSQNGILPEGEKLPIFLNYLNLNRFYSQNYQDHNFLFNLSIPANLRFFQAEYPASILKNNVIINTAVNKFTNNETKFDVQYFHCIAPKQWRDDAFEINHLCPYFHSQISYTSLNKGICASQVNTFISPEAPFSKSHQKLKHILIDAHAISYSKPNLMIENPNVESSHGNTLGGLNHEYLIYLKQRGLSEQASKKILANSAIEHACLNNKFSNILLDYFQPEKGK